jgi:flavin reductase (DIM6/NTAB) family NADH-FMN oxidoreductase RutF
MSIELRRAFGHFATGVTIITAIGPDGRWLGMTANSFTSVSLDPPLVLWSLAKGSSQYAGFLHAPRFAVHVLHEGQAELAQQFACRDRDRFAGVDCMTDSRGIPLLQDFLARFECETRDKFEGGDHVIVLARVDGYLTRAGDPLLFHRSRFLTTRLAADQFLSSEAESTRVEPRARPSVGAEGEFRAGLRETGRDT